MADNAPTPLRRTLRLLFLAVEINLLLWLATLGAVFSTDERGSSVKGVIIVGVISAVLFQHWAYYSVYRRAKEM